MARWAQPAQSPEGTRAGEPPKPCASGGGTGRTAALRVRPRLYEPVTQPRAWQVQTPVRSRFPTRRPSTSGYHVILTCASDTLDLRPIALRCSSPRTVAGDGPAGGWRRFPRCGGARLVEGAFPLVAGERGGAAELGGGLLGAAEPGEQVAA